MNTKKYKLIVPIVFIFSAWAFFILNTLNVSSSFGPSESSTSGFGDTSKTVTADQWISGSVRQVDGVLQISSNGKRIDLSPADFGGEDSFIWKTMEALTKNGREMTKEEVRQLAKSIIEKYLLNIDSWPDIKKLLQAADLTDAEIKSLQKKFESTDPKVSGQKFDYSAVQKLLDLDYTFSNDAPGVGKKLDKPLLDSTSLVSRFDRKTGKFITESGGGELLGLTAHVDYTGTITHDKEVSIVGDKTELETLIRAVELMQSSSIKDRVYDNDRNSPDFYNCQNFVEDTQKMLQDAGIDAYAVGLSGRSIKDSTSVGHAAIAIKVGQVEYPNGDIVPTFAVVETIKTPTVMGQIGGDGTPLSQGYNYDSASYNGGSMNFIVDNAIVFDDFNSTGGADQYAVIQSSSEVYTYTAGEVSVNNDFIKVKGGNGGAMIDK